MTASNQTDGLVLVVDTNPSSGTYNTVVTTIDLGAAISVDPSDIAVTPDGAWSTWLELIPSVPMLDSLTLSRLQQIR